MLKMCVEGVLFGDLLYRGRNYLHVLMTLRGHLLSSNFCKGAWRKLTQLWPSLIAQLCFSVTLWSSVLAKDTEYTANVCPPSLPPSSPDSAEHCPHKIIQSNISSTLAGGKCMTPWWLSEVPLQPVLFWFFNIFHAWICGFSQQLDFLEHAVPVKHIQLHMQTWRQNNLYEQIVSDVTSQVTFITIHMKYWNLWMHAFVFSYIQHVKLSLQRERTL